MSVEEKLISLQKRVADLHTEIAKRDMYIEELENELKVKNDIIRKQTVLNAKGEEE